MLTQTLLFGMFCMLTQSAALAQESALFSLDLPSGDSVDIRQFKADGGKLLLGFACDQGTGIAEMDAASKLSGNHMEIWMPDLLSAYFLPKQKSSIEQIPTEDVVTIIDAAIQASDKQVYLISSGRGSAVLLRGLAQWEQQHPDTLDALHGVVLLYPRLNAGPPEPGKDPVYIDAVGRTKTSIAVLEGAKTPNRWALPGLAQQLRANGSLVTTVLIPGVRGFFYEREQQNLSEQMVSSQLAGLVRASVVKLDRLSQHHRLN